MNHRTWLSLGLLLIPCLVALAEEQPADTPKPEWTGPQLEEAIRAGCDAGHKLHHYRGFARSFDVPGPLWLAAADDERARGVVLPTFLRLFLYGRHRGCSDLDLDDARPLAGPETWVVLWRVEEPHRGRSTPRSDQKILRPKEVRHRSKGAWHHPVRTRTSDRWMRSWFYDDWDDRESLLAIFAQLPHDGSLFVDYDIEERGRSYLTDSPIFGLTTMPAKWWAMAHGDPQPKGGPWWKR